MYQVFERNYSFKTSTLLDCLLFGGGECFVDVCQINVAVLNVNKLFNSYILLPITMDVLLTP